MNKIFFKGESISPLIFYPIHSIYITIGNENPGNLFGGTWERRTECLFGSGNYTVGTTKDFGSMTTTVTKIPDHYHDNSHYHGQSHSHNLSNAQGSHLFLTNTATGAASTKGSALADGNSGAAYARIASDYSFSTAAATTAADVVRGTGAAVATFGAPSGAVSSFTVTSGIAYYYVNVWERTA